MSSKLKSKNIKRTKKSSKRIVKKSRKSFCKRKLSKKIAINLKEMKSGNKKIKSPKQAIAISYNQIKKKYPKCIKSLKKTK